MISEKRIKKYSTRSHKKFAKVLPFAIFPVRNLTGKHGRKLISTIMRDFFFLQAKEKLHLIKIPILYVDTPLDDKIPFTPEKVSDYMTFIDLVLKSLDFFNKRLGYKECAEIANQYMDFVTEVYKSASSIYRFSMTTTHRPKYYKGKFFTIHLLDPHYLCVPSLHVALSLGIYTWFKFFFAADDGALIPKDEAKWRLEEIRCWALKIVESVLFVKQHSINCIPAAVYMLTATMGNDFLSPDDAVDFINMLFCDTDLISAEDKKSLVEHFHFIYERFLLESEYSDRWQEPVERWLNELKQKSQTEE